MKRTLKVDIIGRGNVATHLHKAFLQYGDDIDVRMVNPHTLENLRPEAEITLISVKDYAIPEVCSKLSQIKGIIAHTSGSTPMQVLQSALPKAEKRCGVFYPLQTFSKDVDLNYREIPIFIEGSDKAAEDALSRLASIIFDSIHHADSESRKVLHIASVLACNFANHLWGMSSEILRDNGIPNELIEPLVKETLRKAMQTANPYTVQTGPAIRGDQKIISSHLSYLEKYPQIKTIYSTLTDSIQRCHQ